MSFISVAIEICKLTLDYMQNGNNSNRFQTVASKTKKKYN